MSVSTLPHSNAMVPPACIDHTLTSAGEKPMLGRVAAAVRRMAVMADNVT